MPEILSLLEWIVASKRPLTVDELAQAITIEHGAKSLDFDAIATNPEDILRPCSSLLVISKSPSESSRLYSRNLDSFGLRPSFKQKSTALQVGFGHFSIKEFLVSSRILNYPTVSEFFMGNSEKLEAKLFATCITYLSFDDFCDPDLVKIAAEGNYSLLSYAANYWPQKLSIGQQEMLHETLFRQNDKRANFVHWVALLNHPGFQYRKEDFLRTEDEATWSITELKFRHWQYQREQMVTPLMMSACLGYGRLVELLVPLEVAKVRIHHVKFMKLIEEGEFELYSMEKYIHWLEQIFSPGGSMGMRSWMIALDFGIIAGQVEVVKALLDHGRGSTGTQVDNWSCPLQFILKHLELYNKTGPTMTEIVKLLIDHGANANAQGVLYDAARSSVADIGMVKLLIEHGAGVNVRGGEFGNPIQAAAGHRALDKMKLLIEYGADVNAAGGNYGSALQVAARNKSLDIVKLLIEHGADVNASSEEYGSALQSAADNGSLDMVKLLIEHGADVNAAGGEYGSALQVAARNKSLDMVKLLIEYGADVNAAGGNDGSALEAATKNRDSVMVKLLTDCGAV